MKESLFEQNLRKANELFDENRGKDLTQQEVKEIFFPDKIARFVPKYHKHKQKTALVLLGQSGCGKTTFAKEFTSQHPEFNLVSLDQCVIDKIDGSTNLNNAGNNRFGLLIEQHKQNIIVDGNWLDLNVRSALLNTLHELQFYVILVSFLNKKPEVIKEQLDKRAVQFAALQTLGKSLLFNSHLDDTIVKELAQKSNRSYEDTVNYLKSSWTFKDISRRYLKEYYAEQKNANLKEQLKGLIFLFGADEFFSVA